MQLSGPMTDESLVNTIMDYPGVTGYVECDKMGTVITAEGEEAETFGGVIGYFEQMANLIGESFGLEGIEEAQIISTEQCALCLPKANKVIGVLHNPKTKIQDLLTTLQKA